MESIRMKINWVGVALVSFVLVLILNSQAHAQQETEYKNLPPDKQIEQLKDLGIAVSDPSQVDLKVKPTALPEVILYKGSLKMENTFKGYVSIDAKEPVTVTDFSGSQIKTEGNGARIGAEDGRIRKATSIEVLPGSYLALKDEDGNSRKIALEGYLKDIGTRQVISSQGYKSWYSFETTKTAAINGNQINGPVEGWLSPEFVLVLSPKEGSATVSFGKNLHEISALDPVLLKDDPLKSVIGGPSMSYYILPDRLVPTELFNGILTMREQTEPPSQSIIHTYAVPGRALRFEQEFAISSYLSVACIDPGSCVVEGIGNYVPKGALLLQASQAKDARYSYSQITDDYVFSVQIDRMQAMIAGQLPEKQRLIVQSESSIPSSYPESVPDKLKLADKREWVIVEPAKSGHSVFFCLGPCSPKEGVFLGSITYGSPYAIKFGR